MLNQAPVERLRLTVDTRSGGLGGLPPTIEVGFVPHVLVFLARGEEPFTLAWGAAKAPNTALALATLIPNYRSDQPLAAQKATLEALPVGSMPMPSITGTGAGAATPAKPASKGVLMAVLVVGVLVLGAMAAMLIKQMKNKDEPTA